jgi:hypothetical protein
MGERRGAPATGPADVPKLKYRSTANTSAKYLEQKMGNWRISKIQIQKWINVVFNTPKNIYNKIHALILIIKSTRCTDFSNLFLE